MKTSIRSLYSGAMQCSRRRGFFGPVNSVSCWDTSEKRVALEVGCLLDRFEKDLGSTSVWEERPIQDAPLCNVILVPSRNKSYTQTIPHFWGMFVEERLTAHLLTSQNTIHWFDSTSTPESNRYTGSVHLYLDFLPTPAGKNVKLDWDQVHKTQ